jgi:hypothetical protein
MRNVVKGTDTFFPNVLKVGWEVFPLKTESKNFKAVQYGMMPFYSVVLERHAGRTSGNPGRST